MPRVGIWELLVILLIVVVIFGPKKLPEIGRAIGEAIKEFKKSFKGSLEDDGSKKEEESGKKG